MKKEPKVNKVNEFLEIASDFEDPLEVIRESLSNAYDANATTVDIRIRTRPHGSDIVIEDDGEGMNERDLESFFDLGNSRKTDSIGYKGHGTKIFYKSDAIEVNTAKDGTNRRAVMESPWAKLNRRELPEYELTEQPTRAENPGTLIKIQNFRSGQGFDPESLTYNKIEHYLKWKTIAGSTAYLFDDDFQEMDITVDLDEEIDDSMDQLTTTNKLELPSEQREPSDGEFPAARMCKHYPARELEVDYDGGSTTIQIVGLVGGKETRNEFPTYGRHSAQFGVWFAKDHIKVERLNEAISHDNEFIHFFFVVNCQDFELSANRETIRNKASPVYRAIAEEVEFYLSKVTQDPWFRDYLVTRREGSYSDGRNHSNRRSQTGVKQSKARRCQPRPTGLNYYSPFSGSPVATAHSISLSRTSSRIPTSTRSCASPGNFETPRSISRRRSTSRRRSPVERRLAPLLGGRRPDGSRGIRSLGLHRWRDRARPRRRRVDVREGRKPLRRDSGSKRAAPGETGRRR